MPTLQRAPTREFRTAIMDSRRWQTYQARPDDIVIATYSKCGTTWTQRIVDLLVFQDAAPRPIYDASVWVDCRFFASPEDDVATLETQTHPLLPKEPLS